MNCLSRRAHRKGGRRERTPFKGAGVNGHGDYGDQNFLQVFRSIDCSSDSNYLVVAAIDYDCLVAVLVSRGSRVERERVGDIRGGVDVIDRHRRRGVGREQEAIVSCLCDGSRMVGSDFNDVVAV